MGVANGRLMRRLVSVFIATRQNNLENTRGGDSRLFYRVERKIALPEAVHERNRRTFNSMPDCMPSSEPISSQSSGLYEKRKHVCLAFNSFEVGAPQGHRPCALEIQHMLRRPLRGRNCLGFALSASEKYLDVEMEKFCSAERSVMNKTIVPQ
ncbi:hypothetical protein BDN70DRAFT_894333 [Pholiota conissans]|uniref:Uncharacterized protein n=1 Tax=Pholiota conissans TaxID=109636 RepID=A0A9P5Z2D1_9AGAR|nr:hypothetical protein BDN70DRAFT_894333 [Pholiota conissans]